MEQLNKLKVSLNQFYLGIDLDKPMLSDKEFDALAKEFEIKNNTRVTDLIDWKSFRGFTSVNSPMEPLSKLKVEDNNLSGAVDGFIKENNLEEYMLTYKYDGCAIKIYYTNGRLTKVLSTPDQETGLIRTEVFQDLVPYKVSPDISEIQCEVLVDAGVYGKLARNKANGLVNSIHKPEEVRSECFIRAFKVTFTDGEWSLARNRAALNELDKTMMVTYRNRIKSVDSQETKLSGDIVFRSCESITPEEFTGNPIITEDRPFPIMTTARFQVDGVVLYSDEVIKGFKFYYTDSEITTVQNIVWNKKSNGSFSAVVEIDPISLDEKSIRKVSSNGLRNLIDNKIGIGAKVKVILSNTTIPLITEVIEPSDNIPMPKCDCGYTMTEDDLFGSVLKCGNTGVCSERLNSWLPEITGWLLAETVWGDAKDVTTAINSNPEWFAYAFYIANWDPFDKLSPDADKTAMSQELIKLIEQFNSNDLESLGINVIGWVKRFFKLTALQLKNLTINAVTGIAVLSKLLEVNEFDKLKTTSDEVN